MIGRKDLDRLGRSGTRLQLHSTIEQGGSWNVIASRGRDGTAPLMITTPLSGWFRCAGERGSGIAVLLGLLARLPAELPILVVGTSGHELDFVGARQLLRDIGCAPGAIVHIGASLGVTNPDGSLAARATGTRDLARAGGVASALGAIGLGLAVDDGRWVGEGALWSSLDAPMLSLSGAGVHFHTPDDLPDVTSPATLEEVTAAVAAAVLEVVNSVGVASPISTFANPKDRHL